MIRSMICAAGLVALSLAASIGLSQSYPQRPIRFIVPFAPGGGTDVIARVIAKKLGEIVGQPVVVDNRGGAGGVLATDLAAKAAPDGYTMILSTTALAFSAALYPKLPYDTLRDLAPVTKVAVQPFILVVHPSLPAASVKQLVALAKARPGQITYASGGVGSGFHLAAELLKLKAGIDLLHVPYRGGGPALVDLLSGHVQVMVSTLAITLPYTRAGKLRALAVTVAQRTPAAPDVPTLGEAGVRGAEAMSWTGVFVPARTPPPIIAKLNGELVRMLNMAEVQGPLAAQGMYTDSGSPDELRAFLRAEIEKWGEVVRAAGIRAELPR